MIEADSQSVNFVFVGQFRDHCRVDVPQAMAVVSSALMICEFNHERIQSFPHLHWPPKGGCYTQHESQTFGGFIANNVHHSYTSTAFEWVEWMEVAVYTNGVPTLLHTSRTQHSELFDSIIGSAGFTAILVRVCIRLAPCDTVVSKAIVDKFDADNFVQQMGKVMEKNSICFAFPSLERFLVVRFQRLPGLPQKITQESICYRLVVKSRILKVIPLLRKARQYGDPRAFVLSRFTLMSAVLTMETVDSAATALTAGNERSYPGLLVPIKRGQVPIPDFMVDRAYFIQVDKYARLVALLRDLVYDEPPPLCYIAIRFVPCGGGGMVTPNCSSDCICVEIVGMSKDRLRSWVERLDGALSKEKWRVYAHLGKSPPTGVGKDVYRESLPPSARQRLTNVKKEYDPKNIFDGGKVKFEDIYSLWVLR